MPSNLGTADEWGHGTRVAGVAVFGDLRAQLGAGTLERGARICAAKVVNERGQFDDQRLVPSQMRDALETLHRRFGCRIFVIALADRRSVFSGGKVGTWAATLDELARELDVVIIVSSGNRKPREGNRLEQAVTEYPGYLLENANRFFEPAGALNVITVGALAHGNGLDANRAQDVRVRTITQLHEPSPFSRAGPGISDATKPDVVDLGGTLVFDALVAALRGGDDLPSAGILTLHQKFLDSLFTAGSGTSYAAPRVAFSAAQILARFPRASANLIRALLVGSAEVPQAARDRMQLGGEAIRSVCGFGLIDLERAMFSDDARVVLYAEDDLPLDHFAVYQIPIPEPLQTGNIERCIRVTLAFDPPVRHTRNDYAGVGMSFRLIRGCQPDLIFEHYRKRDQDEERFPSWLIGTTANSLPDPRQERKELCNPLPSLSSAALKVTEIPISSWCVQRAVGELTSSNGKVLRWWSKFCTNPRCSFTSALDSEFVFRPDPGNARRIAVPSQLRAYRVGSIAAIARWSTRDARRITEWRRCPRAWPPARASALRQR